MEAFDTKQVKNLEGKLKAGYVEACKDPKFEHLVKKLHLPESVAMKYTSSLEDTLGELKHCEHCKGLHACQNRFHGHVYFPNRYGEVLVFSYNACKYLKEEQLLEKERASAADTLKNVGMKDIDVSDSKRTPVIKWIKNFYDTFQKNRMGKGLYLYGNFGSGKTFFITALFHELEKKNIDTYIAYYPKLLVELKDDWDTYAGKMEYLQDVDLLLIDDIGAEKVTEWSRDEILGTILQSRMENHKTTFFTSNLDIESLESHFAGAGKIDDKLKARRIIERIRQLTETMELNAENRRK